mgnify:CR=1 FL=1
MEYPCLVRATRGVATIAASVLLLTGSLASAQQLSKAFSDAYDGGIDAFRLGKYAEARKLLGKAAKLEPKLPGPHRFLAAVAQGEGAFEVCLSEAKIAISLNPASNEVGNTQKLHEQCRASLGRAAFTGAYGSGGAIAVVARSGAAPPSTERDGELDGAAVALNRLKYGVTPLEPRAFALGKVEVAVERSGFIPVSVSAEVLPGIVTDVVITLEVDPAAAATDPKLGVGGQPAEITIGWLVLRTTVPAPEITIDGKAAQPDGQGRIEASPGWRQLEVRATGYEPWRKRVRVARGQSLTIDATPKLTSAMRAARRRGFYALGAAVTFGAVGAVFGVLELRARDEAHDLWAIETSRPGAAPLPETGTFEPVRTRADLEDVVARGKRWRAVSWAGYGVGAVALAASVYFFVQERSDDGSSSLSLSPLPPSGSTDGGVGIALTWSGEVW